MKKYLTEFDELQAALKQVKINETVMPYHNGHLVYENADSYAKIQKLLDCPEMASSHRYLYDLDVDDLQENEVQKVDALFDLGVKKGYIDNSFEDEFEKEQAEETGENDEIIQTVCQPCQQKAPVACWTVLYSATKNGEIKTGECYSNAINVQSAKADCLAKLARFGYENVSVLAIEAGDPDLCGCGCDENDMLRNRHHNAHADQPLSEGDDAEADAEQLEETGKNPYAAGLKVVTGNAKPKTPAKSKKLSEDDKESDNSPDSGDTSDSSNGNSDSGSSGGSDSNSSGDSDDSADDSAEDSDDGASSGDDSDGDSEDDDSSDENSSDNSDDEDSSDGSDSEDSDDEESDDSDSEDGSDSENNSSTEDDSDGDESSDDEDSDDEGSDDNADFDDTEDEKELSDDEKSQFKDEYKRAFKETMLKCKFEGKCFNDLTLDQKVNFFTKLSEKWTKADPKKFMTDKEQDQLEAVVMSK